MKKKPIIKYLTDFLDYLEVEKGLSNKTQENYSRFLSKFFNWLSDNGKSDLMPEDLDVDDIWRYRLFLSRYINPLNKEGLKKSTQNYYLIALRSFLDFMVEKDIKSLPPGKVKLAKDKADKNVKFLNLDQIKKLLDTPDTRSIIGLRDKALLETLFSTGLRVSELVSLDVEPFRVSRSGGDMEMAVVGKGKRVRSVYFSSRCIENIKKYINNRADFDKALFINYKPGIEKTNIPRRLTPKSVEDIVKKYVKMVGLPVAATPHTIRHSFATDLLINGIDLRMVQEFLGHKNISTTQIYTHVTNKQLRDAHKRIHGERGI